MRDDAFIDQLHLQTDAYADARKFSARVGIYRFQVPDIDFGAWALAHLPASAGAVLDVGCGPGSYLRDLRATKHTDRLVGLDLSPGMLADVGDVGASLCAGDAQSLPFPDASFDTTLCMHMLYHVPDIDRAVGELRRVTKPGGVVLVATNGDHHHRALRAVFDEAVAELSGGDVQPILTSARRFRLENGGTALRAHFDSVVRQDLRRELVIPEVSPILTYLESIRSFHEAKLPRGVGWEDAMRVFGARAQVVIDREGAFRSPTVAGVFLCR